MVWFLVAEHKVRWQLFNCVNWWLIQYYFFWGRLWTLLNFVTNWIQIEQRWSLRIYIFIRNKLRTKKFSHVTWFLSRIHCKFNSIGDLMAVWADVTWLESNFRWSGELFHRTLEARWLMVFKCVNESHNQRAFEFTKSIRFLVFMKTLTIYDPRVHKLHTRNINKTILFRTYVHLITYAKKYHMYIYPNFVCLS